MPRSNSWEPALVLAYQDGNTAGIAKPYLEISLSKITATDVWTPAYSVAEPSLGIQILIWTISSSDSVRTTVHCCSG